MATLAAGEQVGLVDVALVQGLTTRHLGGLHLPNYGMREPVGPHA